MQQQTILIVDDNPGNLTVLGDLLQPRYRVRAANSGERALRLVRSPPRPDLVLLDVMMPGMSGYEVLEHLREHEATRDIPVIFVTAMNAQEDEQRGLVMGAVDYIAKPIRPAIVLARVHTHLLLKQARDRLEGDVASLRSELNLRNSANLLTQDVTIRVLARLAEARDNETGHHIMRTQAYVQALARRARQHPLFAVSLDERTIAQIVKSAPLHDIGKVGIPDHVLCKPGPLDAQEWAIMKTHARLGADVISRAEADAQQPVEFLRHAKQMALHHHERWDGTGYPDGLAGEDIPLSARLMAIADVFDSLICERAYKRSMSFEQAHAAMVAERGSHFDPDLLDLFVDGFDEFSAIARRYRDAAMAVPPAPGAAA
ncbi:MAG: two-component system response regulator [Burkholderiales bacterium]|nr:two-component system response regulator [Burkholderiales bacterium]